MEPESGISRHTCTDRAILPSEQEAWDQLTEYERGLANRYATGATGKLTHLTPARQALILAAVGWDGLCECALTDD